jgi:hypothetical protein
VRHVRVPGVDEALDLAAREGQQFACSESFEFPVLALVGVGTASDEEAALAVHPGEGLNGLLDLGAPAFGVGNFVESVEQDQPAAAEQFAMQGVVVGPQLLGPLADDEAPQRAGVDHGVGRQAGGEIAQHDAHRQQGAVRPALPLRLEVGFTRNRLAEKLQIGGGRMLQFASQAQGDEVEEGRLAAPRSAHQHQRTLAVERFERRQAFALARLAVAGLAGRARGGRQEAAVVACRGEQRSVDRRQLHHLVVADEERQPVGLRDQPAQISLAQFGGGGV